MGADAAGAVMRWRIARNEWNLRGAPWHGAFGIEEDDEQLAVPGMICWFYRGTSIAEVQAVVDAHNALELEPAI